LCIFCLVIAIFIIILTNFFYILLLIDRDGFTPIHIAAKNGHKDVLWEFYQRDFDLQVKTVQGYTPLMIATGPAKTFLNIFIIRTKKLQHSKSLMITRIPNFTTHPHPHSLKRHSLSAIELNGMSPFQIWESGVTCATPTTKKCFRSQRNFGMRRAKKKLRCTPKLEKSSIV